MKVPADRVGQLASCESCKQEITLDRPSGRSSSINEYGQVTPATMAHIKSQAVLSREMIGIGYLLALLLPLVGFVVGIYFLTKNQFNHGIGCMIVSLIGSGLWFGVVSSIGWL